jgi:hypothetical protein
MVSAVSLTSLLLGAALAYTASRVPAHVEVLETISGALLVGGLALLGSALPVVS